MKIEVTYMSGAGNLFTVINNEIYNLSLSTLEKIAPILCGTQGSSAFRTEGLISMSPVQDGKLNFTSDFFNPDGSHQAMCGNGGRCAVAYYKKNYAPELVNNTQIFFLMAGNTYHASFRQNEVQLYFPSPNRIVHNKKIVVGEQKIIGSYVDVGSEHFVVDFENLKEFHQIGFRNFNLSEFAEPIRHHMDFAPTGVNVNVYRVKNEQIHLRTFERGVEAETGACGTGALATTLVAFLNDKSGVEADIVPPANVPLKVKIIANEQKIISALMLQGPAVFMETVTLDIPDSLIHS